MARVTCNKVEKVFNPLTFYEGNYIFPIDTLYDCSKIVDGENLVREYFYDNYLHKLNSLIDDFELCMKGIALKSDVTLMHDSRELKVSLEYICYAICEKITGNLPELTSDYFKNKEILVEFFRNYKKAINCLKDKKATDEYQEECSVLKQLYEDSEARKKEKLGSKFVPSSFNTFLDKVRDYIVTFLVRYNQMAQVCDKKISLDVLNESLDLEKFEFAMTKILIDLTKLVEKNEGKVHNSFVYVDCYMKKVQTLKKEKNYDFQLKMTCFDWQRITIKLDDLITDWQDIRKRHPEE